MTMNDAMLAYIELVDNFTLGSESVSCEAREAQLEG